MATIDSFTASPNPVTENSIVTFDATLTLLTTDSWTKNPSAGGTNLLYTVLDTASYFGVGNYVYASILIDNFQPTSSPLNSWETMLSFFNTNLSIDVFDNGSAIKYRVNNNDVYSESFFTATYRNTNYRLEIIYDAVGGGVNSVTGELTLRIVRKSDSVVIQTLSVSETIDPNNGEISVNTLSMSTIATIFDGQVVGYGFATPYPLNWELKQDSSVVYSGTSTDGIVSQDHTALLTDDQTSWTLESTNNGITVVSNPVTMLVESSVLTPTILTDAVVIYPKESDNWESMSPFSAEDLSAGNTAFIFAKSANLSGLNYDPTWQFSDRHGMKLGAIGNSFSLMEKVRASTGTDKKSNGVGGSSQLNSITFTILSSATDIYKLYGCPVEFYSLSDVDRVIQFTGFIYSVKPGEDLISITCRGKFANSEYVVSADSGPVLFGGRYNQYVKLEQKTSDVQSNLTVPETILADVEGYYVKDNNSERYFPIKNTYTFWNSNELVFQPSVLPSERTVVTRNPTLRTLSFIDYAVVRFYGLFAATNYSYTFPEGGTVNYTYIEGGSDDFGGYIDCQASLAGSWAEVLTFLEGVGVLGGVIIEHVYLVASVAVLEIPFRSGDFFETVKVWGDNAGTSTITGSTSGIHYTRAFSCNLIMSTSEVVPAKILTASNRQGFSLVTVDVEFGDLAGTVEFIDMADPYITEQRVVTIPLLESDGVARFDIVNGLTIDTTDLPTGYKQYTHTLDNSTGISHTFLNWNYPSFSADILGMCLSHDISELNFNAFTPYFFELSAARSALTAYNDVEDSRSFCGMAHIKELDQTDPFVLDSRADILYRTSISDEYRSHLSIKGSVAKTGITPPLTDQTCYPVENRVGSFLNPITLDELGETHTGYGYAYVTSTDWLNDEIVLDIVAPRLALHLESPLADVDVYAKIAPVFDFNLATPLDSVALTATLGLIATRGFGFISVQFSDVFTHFYIRNDLLVTGDSTAPLAGTSKYNRYTSTGDVALKSSPEFLTYNGVTWVEYIPPSDKFPVETSSVFQDTILVIGDYVVRTIGDQIELYWLSEVLGNAHPVDLIRSLVLGYTDLAIDTDSFDLAKSLIPVHRASIRVDSDVTVESLISKISKEHGLFTYETKAGVMGITSLVPQFVDDTTPALSEDVFTLTNGVKKLKEQIYSIDYLINEIDVKYNKQGDQWDEIKSADLISQTPFETASTFLNGRVQKITLELETVFDEETARGCAEVKANIHSYPTREITLAVKEVEARNLDVGQWYTINLSSTDPDSAVLITKYKGLDYTFLVFPSNIYGAELIQEVMDDVTTAELWQEDLETGDEYQEILPRG